MNRFSASPRPAPLRDLLPTDGILLVDKPAGPTSHDIVDQIRRRFRLPKVGHGGTLDPQATGLLIILTGKGTKLSNAFLSSDKLYEGDIHLGIRTDSQDAQGQVLAEQDASGISREQLEAAMESFVGDIMQTPPMVSAVKVEGVPLYKRARKGQTVERQPRLVHIYEFKLLSFNSPIGAFRIRCTKGTYVRTLCDDAGTKLGCGAHLARLRRLASGALNVADAIPFDDILAMDLPALTERIIPMARAAAMLTA